MVCSGFPYYSFEDRHMAQTIGSAFYAIYFLGSFPIFFRLDENPKAKFSFFQTVIESMGCSMLVMIGLDAVRLWVGAPFVMEIEQ
jgi:cycloeucalenol cycloisomerase